MVLWLTEPVAANAVVERIASLTLLAQPEAEALVRRLTLDYTDKQEGLRLEIPIPKRVEGIEVDEIVRFRTAEITLAAQDLAIVSTFDVNATDTDADFLNKATTESRGSAPTRLEREYFLADKTPKKREKLLDLLLSDPAIAQKVGPEWKKTMLNPTATWVYLLSDGGHDWSKLIGELIAAKKTDDQMLEALALAITGRLATDGEKKLAGAMVAKQKDKPTAWAEVATALAGTDEAKKHAQKLKGKANVSSIEWYGTVENGTGKFEVVPVPVAPKK